MNDILGFCRFMLPDDTFCYGVRGIGDKYDHFHGVYIVDKNILFKSTDFPWSYFIFLDENERLAFEAEYNTDIDRQDLE